MLQFRAGPACRDAGFTVLEETLSKGFPFQEPTSTPGPKACMKTVSVPFISEKVTIHAGTATVWEVAGKQVPGLSKN